MGNQGVRFLQTADLERERGQQGKPYLEFGRLAGMSAGVYLLEAGSTDHQSPHQQDEMYYVVRGRARMRAGDDDQPVKQGSIILVPAKVEHRFYDIEEAITLLVFFGPAEAE
jgi:mannose-6-phosphate isomerase-like protein (cupin superfamily)